MQKIKKFIIGLLVFALIIGGMIYGLTIYVKWTGDGNSAVGNMQEAEEGTKYPILTETTYFGYISAPYFDDMEDFIIPALELADSKYIWMDENAEVYGVSAAFLENKLNEKYGNDYSEFTMPRFINSYLKMGANITHNFTDGYNRTSYKFEECWFKFGIRGVLIDAFGDVFPVEECLSDSEHNDNPLKEKGLDLDMKNIEVEKIMMGPFYWQHNWFVMQVGADVKCQKRSDVFEDLDWIPEKGETEHITFFYLCYTDKNGGDGLYPVNIVAIPEE